MRLGAGSGEKLLGFFLSFLGGGGGFHRWFQCRVCAAQLGLIYAADKAVSLRLCSLREAVAETAFPFISDSPSPSGTLQLFFFFFFLFLRQSRA